MHMHDRYIFRYTLGPLDHIFALLARGALATSLRALHHPPLWERVQTRGHRQSDIYTLVQL